VLVDILTDFNLLKLLISSLEVCRQRYPKDSDRTVAFN